MSTKKNLKIFVVSILLSTCKQITTVSTTAYVIGPNDINTVTQDNVTKIPPSVQEAAVLLTITINHGKRKFCSGTLIPGEPGANYRILTNHHCFAPEEDDKRKVTDEIVENACEGARVFFGFFRDQLDTREVGRCLPGTFRNDFQGDLAIFTLEQNPTERFKPAEFWAEAEVPGGRQGLIMHFPAIDSSDPEAEKNLVLEPEAGIKVPVAQITTNDCETLGPFPAQEWQLDKSLKMGFKHSCDLKKGSSGSGLWDAETGRLIGVNWGGITLKYTDPDRTEVFNVATNISYVKLFLEHKEQEELKRLSSIESENKNLASGDAVAQNHNEGTLDQKRMGGCSVSSQSRGAANPWLLGLLLLAPALAAFYCRLARKAKVS